MKQKNWTILLALAAIFVMGAFGPKDDKYVLDVAKSSITWEGKKVGGSRQGTLKFKEGQLGFKGTQLSSGGFSVDMTTLKDADGSEDLEKHLKNDDFFGVPSFPVSSFVIKAISGKGTNVTIKGNLTIKGKTLPITFPAKITWNADKTVTATADKISIDRTKFGIKYKSKSIFSDLGDKFIEDEFIIAVKIIAKKA